MKTLLTAAALSLALATAAQADCSPPMEDIVAAFDANEHLVVYACQRRYPMRDMNTCLDWQFDALRSVAAHCDGDPRIDTAIEAGRIYDRRGELVGVDFQAVTLELLKLGVY